MTKEQTGERKPNIYPQNDDGRNIEILRLFGARNKRHRSHLQRKLNVSFDACSSLTTFVPLLTPAQNDGLQVLSTQYIYHRG